MTGAYNQFDGSSRRLWSLWDMIRFRLDGMSAFVVSLEGERQQARSPFRTFNDVDKARLGRLLEYGARVCAPLDLSFTQSRIASFHQSLSRPLWGEDVQNQVKTILEVLKEETSLKAFFYVQPEKAKELTLLDVYWSATLKAFPSTKTDINSAASCYMTDNNTACVFHSMRVLEKGLLKMARNLRVPHPEQDPWNKIIDRIESKIKEIKSAGVKGPKEKRAIFLSKAAAEFRHFKDGWRNYVSHGKSEYDEIEAMAVMVHVRGFMNHLSSQLHE